MIIKTLLTVVLPLGYALPWDGPKATAMAELGSVELFKREQYGVAPVAGWNPIPTRKPGGFFEDYALWKRSSALSLSLTSSNYSYNTCGFLSGATGSCSACPQFVSG
jgi:hypothetical protein